MNNTQLLVDGLDFVSIKNNLKEFLRGQDQFKDYNFDGSNINVLLDILAYNTYYNNLYQSMTINEAFLDSASKRSSVVSIANGLGYTPHSAKASSAIIDLDVIFETDAQQLLLERGQVFSATNNGETFQFVLISEMISQKNDFGVFSFKDVEIFGGSLVYETFINDENGRFILGNKLIDADTIQVSVSANMNDTNYQKYVLADNITSLTPESTAYFLKENEDGFLEIQFGDGKISKKLSFGAIINVSYIVTPDISTDGCNNFRPILKIPGVTNPKTSVTVKQASTGWSEKENLTSIKYNAPKLFAAQNRCVTTGDVESLVLSKFNNVKSIISWDGTTNTPIAYNTIFVSIKPKYSDSLTPTEKSYILNNILRNKVHPGVNVIFKEPEYIDISVEAKCYYDEMKTSKSLKEIYNTISSNVFSYIDAFASSFGADLKYSRLLQFIDNLDPSISNSVVNITLKKNLVPKLDLNGTYKFSFDNKIVKNVGSISSNTFYMQDSSKSLYYLENDMLGNIWVKRVSETTSDMQIDNVGFVDFNTGSVSISNLNISALTDGEFIISGIPSNLDINTSKNQVLRLNKNDISVILEKTNG